MRKILMAVLISTSTWAVADDNIVYTCKMADKVRLITVVYAEPGEKAPCTVDYQVDGVSKTLWNYPNSVGHCEKVAEEFAAKQKGWGWACTSSAEATPTAAQ